MALELLPAWSLPRHRVQLVPSSLLPAVQYVPALTVAGCVEATLVGLPASSHRVYDSAGTRAAVAVQQGAVRDNAVCGCVTIVVAVA